MRAVIDAAEDGDAHAGLALDVYLHRLRAGIAAMTASMDGLDGIVWTGGVGEHAPEIRAAATDGLGFLGLHLDHDKNQTAAGDQDLSAPGSTARTLVIAAREDLEIARQVRGVLC
jgi:acetate kinase